MEVDGSVVLLGNKDGTPPCRKQPIIRIIPRIPYHSWPEFHRYAQALGLMDDEKAGIPRTACEGIVETRPFGDEQLLFLLPVGIKSTV